MVHMGQPAALNWQRAEVEEIKRRMEEGRPSSTLSFTKLPAADQKEIDSFDECHICSCAVSGEMLDIR